MISINELFDKKQKFEGKLWFEVFKEKMKEWEQNVGGKILYLGKK